MRAATFVGMLGMAAGLVISPAILSVSTLLTGFAACLSQPPGRQLRKFFSEPGLWLLVLFFPLHLIASLWTEDKTALAEDLRIKMPLLFVPWALAVTGPWSRRELSAFFALLVLTVFVVGTGTVSLYFMNYAEVNHQIAIAKPVATFLGTNHIYFSIALFISVFAAAWLFLRGEPLFFKWEKYLFGVMALLMTVYLHIITTRTGIVAFYGGLMATVIYYLISSRRWITGLALLLLIGLAPVMAYYTVPSLRHRIDVTLTDLEAIRFHIDPNDYSLATRVEAWRTALHVWQRAPWLGVGIADMQAEMAIQYDLDQTELEHRNREMPHNQFLEVLAGLGLIGFIPFVMSWLAPMLVSAVRNRDWLLPALWAGLTLALNVESVMERQIGVAVISLVWGLLCVRGAGQSRQTV